MRAHPELGATNSQIVDGSLEWLPHVYQQLRALAAGLMAGERSSHTLQPTALVHEAWLRLASGPADARGAPAELLRSATTTMRRILVDHARRRGSAKRGGSWGRTTLESIDLSSEEDCDRLLSLDEAISCLELEDARAAEIVRLRFYAGLSVDETAETTGLSRRTVLRDWEFARAWLLHELQSAITD